MSAVPSAIRTPRAATLRKQEAILAASLDQSRLEAMPVDEYVGLYVL